MTPFDDEQHKCVREISDASHARGQALVAEEVIGVAARAYFCAVDATHSEAMHLCDIIMSSLGEAEEREADA